MTRKRDQLRDASAAPNDVCEFENCVLPKGHEGEHSPVLPELEEEARHEEWHVTVTGVDPITWHLLCGEAGIKPLYIELSNRSLQLMCASATDPRQTIEELFEDRDDFPNFKIVRVKHEVSALRDGEKPCYFECHVKIDGTFRPDFGMASRDLYRGTRWYVTRRMNRAFDAESFAGMTARRLAQKSDQAYDSYEYEACIMDTNPGLDSGWTE